MAARGVKPTDGPKVYRGQAMTDWTEVEYIPFEDAPELPDRAATTLAADGAITLLAGDWPQEALRKWRAWSTMPHAKNWTAPDWEFAFDSLEVAASFIETSRVGLATELRNREKLLGTTAEARRDLRIRYVEKKQEGPHLTVVTNDFTDL